MLYIALPSIIQFHIQSKTSLHVLKKYFHNSLWHLTSMISIIMVIMSEKSELTNQCSKCLICLESPKFLIYAQFPKGLKWPKCQCLYKTKTRLYSEVFDFSKKAAIQKYASWYIQNREFAVGRWDISFREIFTQKISDIMKQYGFPKSST